jgi:hypothetical protein
VAKDFSSNLSVQTGSGTHPASCTKGTEGSFPKGKARPGRDADHSPHLVPRSRMSRSYTSSPPKRLRDVYWESFTLDCFSKLDYSVSNERVVSNHELERMWKEVVVA